MVVSEETNGSSASMDLNLLIRKLGQSYDQTRFSLRFKDQQLEQEFQRLQHKNVIELGKIYAIEVLAVTVIYLSFSIYDVTQSHNLLQFGRALCLALVLLGIVALHYYLSRKYPKIALQFANIQTFIYMVFIVEEAVTAINNIEMSEIFSTLTTLVASISIMSYCQVQLFLSYVVSWSYVLVRTYFSTHEVYRWSRFNLFNLASMTAIYIFSRRYHQKQRLEFQQQKNAHQLLNMFQNLIKVYHDGILITQGEQIILKNKQINNIFNVNSEETDDDVNYCFNQNQMEDNSFANYCHSAELIGAFRSAMPCKQGLSLFSPNFTDRFVLDNIWDYIVQNYEMAKNPGVINPLSDQIGGMYFKYKYEDNQSGNELKTKKIQVFSQQVQIGQKFLIMTTIRDMSQWLELEKQRHLTNIRTVAFASAAHEFRNPLNAITQTLDILTNIYDKERQNQYFTTARNCSNLMLFLVNDILDFAQLESNKLILNYQKITVREIIEDCMDVLMFKARAKGIDLHCEIRQDFPKYIYSDVNRLKQVFINLLSNGIKYTERGYVKLIAERDEQLNQIRIMVKDTGVGIEPDKVKDLFQVFIKIQRNRALNKEGVGLGLTISKNLVKALGGDIEVESEVGVGTTFTVSLPINQQLSECCSFSSHDISVNLNEISQILKCNQKPKTLLDNKMRTISTSEIQMQSFAEENTHDYQRTQQFGQLNTQYQSTNGPASSRNLLKKSTSFFSNAKSLVKILKDDADLDNGVQHLEKSLAVKSKKLCCNCTQILLVDDEAFNLLALQGQLESLGVYNCDQAQNGLEALKLIERNNIKSCIDHIPYKLILTDNRMPVMNGIELATKIRQLQQSKDNSDSDSLSQMKIVLLTGDTNIQERYLFDQILEKPFKIPDLISILKKTEII